MDLGRGAGSFAGGVLPFPRNVRLIHGGWKCSSFSIVHEAFYRINDFGILNSELVNGSFNHDTSLTGVRIYSNLYVLFVIVTGATEMGSGASEGV